MLDRSLTLPEDPEELSSFTARLLAEVKTQAILIEKLRHQLAGHRAHRFGASSETAEQLQLALETSEIAAAAMTARMKLPDIEEKDKPKRRPIPDHIPRMEVELTPGAEACADCGGRLRRIGEDVTEELEYVPGRFIVNRIVRPRLTCACCERFVQASLPSRPIERGRPGPGLLAHVLVSKYADHLPLYRQSQILARAGLDLHRAVLADWVGKAAFHLTPVVDRLAEHLKRSGKLFMDETTAPVLDPGRGTTKTGYLWALAGDDRPWGGEDPPGVVYFYAPGRAGENAETFLTGFDGILQIDGYTGYNRLTKPSRKGGAPIRVAHCWAHARRKLKEIFDRDGSEIAAEGLRRIAEFYQPQRIIPDYAGPGQQVPLDKLVKVGCEGNLWACARTLTFHGWIQVLS